MDIFLKFFEIIIGILVVMFACVFTIVGVGMVVAKESISNMISFRGDKKDE